MLLADLRVLFSALPADTSPLAYRQAITEANDLAKPTQATRKWAWRYLHALYTLDLHLPIFRNMRRLWTRDTSAQPQLALAAALAADPLLRASATWLLAHPHGQTVTREALEAHLAACWPDRYNANSLEALANRINGTWTQAGNLSGKVRKVRQAPVVRPENLAFSLFLAHLEGASGAALLKSPWLAPLDLSLDHRQTLLQTAADMDLLVVRMAPGVMEIRFPGWLTPEDAALREEAARESA